MKIFFIFFICSDLIIERLISGLVVVDNLKVRFQTGNCV